MKNKLLLSIATVLLLASCSTKIGLVKRKYNKGFYVSVTKKQPDAATHTRELKTTVAKNTPSKAEPVNVQKVPSVLITEVVDKPVVVANNTKNKATVTNNSRKHAVASETKNTGSEPVLLASAKENKGVKKVKQFKALSLLGKASKKGGDTNLVLLVILSLFPILALIAIYLKDGKITMNFWIDLILHFILLYWLFALLVVLDVINLA